MLINDFVATLPSEEERLYLIEDAARHLIEVFGLAGTSGPLFILNNQDHDEKNIAVIRHAILDLQSKLDGTPLPEIVFLDPRDLH